MLFRVVRKFTGRLSKAKVNENNAQSTHTHRDYSAKTCRNYVNDCTCKFID